MAISLLPPERPDAEAARFELALGYAFLRLTLGLNFLFHSYGRWLDLEKFVDTVTGEFARLPLPFWEPLVGGLLVLGLWTRWALAAGAFLIALLTFGTALRGEYPVLGTNSSTR